MGAKPSQKLSLHISSSISFPGSDSWITHHIPVVASNLTLPMRLRTVPETLPLSNNRSPDGILRPSIGGVVALQHYHVPYKTTLKMLLPTLLFLTLLVSCYDFSDFVI